MSNAIRKFRGHEFMHDVTGPNDKEGAFGCRKCGHKIAIDSSVREKTVETKAGTSRVGPETAQDLDALDAGQQKKIPRCPSM